MSAFEELLDNLDIIARDAFDRDGLASLIVVYKFDPLDGPMGTDEFRVGFRGGRFMALGACEFAKDHILNESEPAE